MKVLVTGGAGFIGSHTVDALLARGCGVRVLDDFSTGRRENLAPRAKLEVFEGDVAEQATVARAIAGVEAVVHLAAIASVQASVDDPVTTHRVNLDGTLILLEAARRAGIGRFLYASSAAVYGDRAALPVNEGATPHPLTPYAIDKLAGEQYLGFYARSHGLDAMAFRFFNVYGPRQDPGSPYSGVISIFADRARSGRAVTIYGDGGQTRDFVYVADVVDLLIEAILGTHPLGGRVLNLGTGRAQSLLELLAVIESLRGGPLERRHDAARPGDIRESCADVTGLRAFFGRVPGTSLRAGLGALWAALQRN